MAKFESIDDYLASLDETKANTLRTLIGLVSEEFPQLECKLAWNVPQFHRDGTYVFGIGALKNHLDINPWSGAVMDEFRERLTAEGYDVTKHLVKIPVDWTIDRDLVVGLIEARLNEIDAA